MKKIAVALAAIAAAVSAGAAGLDVAGLNAKFASGDRVSFRADDAGEPIAVLKDANGKCEVKLRGAHVISCAFAGDEHPLLFVPSKGFVHLDSPRGFIHGGIPLLWPWFGSSGAPELGSWRGWLNAVGFSFETAAPIHGTARSSLFSVKGVSAAGNETAITLVLRPCEEVAEFTEGDFELEYTITLGAHRLGLKLTTRNLGGETFRYREGFHPYFSVSSGFDVELAGVDGCSYESNRSLPYDEHHVWKGGKVPQWPGCDLFRFKEEKSVITLEDPGWKRDIVLSTTGGRDVVTYSQSIMGVVWGGKSNLYARECPTFFCIEPSNYFAESEIALGKGEAHTLETVVTVRNR